MQTDCQWHNRETGSRCMVALITLNNILFIMIQSLGLTNETITPFPGLCFPPPFNGTFWPHLDSELR